MGGGSWGHNQGPRRFPALAAGDITGPRSVGSLGAGLSWSAIHLAQGGHGGSMV